jgi:hypothetical protein
MQRSGRFTTQYSGTAQLAYKRNFFPRSKAGGLCHFDDEVRLGGELVIIVTERNHHEIRLRLGVLERGKRNLNPDSRARV